MKILYFLLIFIFFNGISEASFEVQKRIVTPQNVAKLEAEFIPDSSQNEIWLVTHTDFIDWKSVRPENYEEIYAQISDDFFLSRFSMKYGFRLESFFPLLFPQNIEKISHTEQQIQEKITQIKSDINQVLHEIHRDFFLLPLLAWTTEKHILLEYEIQENPSIPASFLIEESLLLHHISASTNENTSHRLAVSVARQNGNLTLNRKPVCYSSERTVLLFPDSTTCEEIENISEDIDFLSEFQIPYATTQFTSGVPTIGWGAASWKTIQLLMVRTAYRPETQNFLNRFEGLGGKILERTKKNEKIGGKE